MMQNLAVAAIIASASAASTLNPDVSVYGCDHLSCSDSARNNSICGVGSSSALGVGFAANAVNLSSSDTGLSLTLVDGYPLGIFQSLPSVNYTTRSLYVGAPASTNLLNQTPGCALLLQYDQATFPYSGSSTPPSSFYQNTTACPASFTASNALESVSSLVQGFRYSNSSLPRCQALAAYVEYKVNQQNLTLGAFSAPLIGVSGGAITGPDAATGTANIIYSVSGDVSADACAPVEPQAYHLYNVTSATEILRGYPTSSNQTYGGRDGFSPIVTVLYSDDEGMDPEVAVFCMHIYNTAGNALPYSTIGYVTSAGVKLSPASAAVIFFGALAGVWMSL